MPTITFESLEAIPEELRETAKEEDGKFSINVVPKSKLDEFRQKNIELNQQQEALLPTLERMKAIVGDDMDLDAFENDLQGMREIAQKVKDGELTGSDQIEKAVSERLAKVKEGFEQNQKAERDQRTKAERERDEARAELERTHIRSAITQVVIDPNSGVRADALPDIIERANKLFRWKDGRPVPMNGESIVYGPDGADPMTPKEWLAQLRDEAPYFFAGNGGGGANGGKDAKHGMSPADFAKLSPTEKLRLANGA